MTLKGYRIPVEHFPFKIACTGQDKAPLKCFVDIFAKNKLFVPACKYEVSTDWKSVLPNRGKWLKSERVTSTMEEIKAEKKKAIPGPGMYEMPKTNESFGFGGTKDKSGARVEKHIPEIWQAEWAAQQTPGAKYEPSHKLIESSLVHLKFPPEPKNKSILGETEKQPEVGTYDPEPSFKKLLANPPRVKMITGKPKECFIDEIKRKKKWCPGSGTYDVTPEHFRRLSKSPPSIRIRRH